MPRPPLRDEITGQARVERSLYYRCRQGQPEALATLLYRLADRLYTAAAYVAPDEASARAAVADSWGELIALLQRPRTGGQLRRHSERILARHLAAWGSKPAIERALRTARQQDESELLVLSDEALQPLLEQIPRQAEQIASHTATRHLHQLQLAIGLGLVLLVVGIYAGWLRSLARHSRPQIQMMALQERIVRTDLLSALRDSLLELPDPEGADYLEAWLLQRVSLVLEEIVNTPQWGNPAIGRRISERVQQEELSQLLRELMVEREGLARHELAQVQLVLEEVGNL